PSLVGGVVKPWNTAISDTTAPNARLLNSTPLTMSVCTSTTAVMFDQNVPLSMPSQVTPTRWPPKIAIAQNTQHSSGIATSPARKRGVATEAIGSTAIISIAEIWSVARIRPISAVSEVPARPANSSAVTTGPSSRYTDSATTMPLAEVPPKIDSTWYSCSISTMPTNRPQTMMMVRLIAPTNHSWRMVSRT